MVWGEMLTYLEGFFSGEFSLLFTLIFFTSIIILYAVFVYYFYLYLAKKNIIELNLAQYNRYDNPTMIKFFAFLFYVIEYLILLPIMTIFWFTVFSILFMMLAEGVSIATVLIISTALVASVRATSFISSSLARDLAKMVPFTLLAVALTKPGFFEVSAIFERASEIPALFSTLPYYVLFIIGTELVMRIIEFTTDVFSSFNTQEEQE